MTTDDFKKITIVGVGLIGGSLGLALKRKGFKGRISGVSQPKTIEAAIRLGAIDEGFSYQGLAKAVDASDIVYLCTPIGRILELVEELGAIGGKLKKGCIITDVGSTKQEICRRATEKLPQHCAFIGGHPMAGSEKTGVEAADPFLFENAIYVLAPGRTVPADASDSFASFTRMLGAQVILLDPASHDNIAATISHVPQLLATTLMNWAAKKGAEHEATLRLAAGGFRDMTRIASSPFDMWKDILATNQEVIERRLDDFIAELKRASSDIAAGKLADRFSAARAARNTIPRDTKGFMHQLYEIMVVADDKPGVIARISKVLADANVNINDIEVVKVREGEGGTIRMAFESRGVAQKAVGLLAGAAFTARMRE